MERIAVREGRDILGGLGRDERMFCECYILSNKKKEKVNEQQSLRDGLLGSHIERKCITSQTEPRSSLSLHCHVASGVINFPAHSVQGARISLGELDRPL